MNSRLYVYRLAVIMLALVGSSCSPSPDLKNEFKILTPESAKEIHTIKMFKGTQVQHDYLVEKEYPGLAITKDMLMGLRNRGWQRCTQTTKNWTKYIDATRKTGKKCIYKYSESYLKDRQLMFISQEYESNILGKYECPTVPDNSHQRVFISVLIYPNRQRVDWKRFGISCAGNTQP